MAQNFTTDVTYWQDKDMIPKIAISQTYLNNHPEITSVMDLPRNAIYAINTNVPTSFGLPLQSHATLFIYYPELESGTGFTVYEYYIGPSYPDSESAWLKVEDASGSNTVSHNEKYNLYIRHKRNAGNISFVENYKGSTTEVGSGINGILTSKTQKD